MASSVYSVRFLAQYASVLDQVYEVPAGYRAIVRDMDAYNAPGGSPDDYVYVWVEEIEGAFAYQKFDGVGWVSWRGRQVINEGEHLAVGNNSASMTMVMVSGYLLTLP